VVVSLDHPYGTGPTLFPDGRLIRNSGREWLEFGSLEAYERSRNRVERELETRVADVQFVLDQLSHPSGPLCALGTRADVDRAAVIGHSFGGTVAAEVCHRDCRFRCAVNMDGLMMGRSADFGVRQPLLTMSDDTPLPLGGEIEKMDDSQQLYYHVLLGDIANLEFTIETHGGYMFRLRGANHMNFSDTPLYSRLRRFTGAGRIGSATAFAIIRACALAFFDEYLKDLRRPLLDDVSMEFSEVADYRCRKRRELTGRQAISHGM
jgi:pimeloyl-ACP methyl ester carboxylesterase